MNRPVISLSLVMLLCGTSLVQAAEELPPDLQRIEMLQRRADKMAFGEIGPNNYYLAKARTWLNFALSECYLRDSTNVVAATIGQAEALLDALENKQTGVPQDTPKAVDSISEAVRPDLWDKIAALKGHANFSCGQRQIAEAEVHLVWTAHKKAEYGWSHAESYARTAEDLVHEAQMAVNDCAEAALVTPATRTRVIEKITQSGDALFEFGKAKLNSYSLWRIDKFVDRIRELTSLEKVELVGHTDHLSKDGRQKFNMLLSRQRAESIKQYLVSKGVPTDKILASGAGSSKPLVKCSPRQSRKKQIACLQPNRRVEIVLRGSTQERFTSAQDDLRGQTQKPGG